MQTPYPNKKNNDRRPKSSPRPVTSYDASNMGKRETDHIPPLKDGDIRIIHLGGVEEIGRNMSLVEYKDTIIVVDCGVQFTETNTPGIDFILPNTRYLEEHKHKIKGVLVTHGHLDHIGAFPYIMPRIGNPPVYARLFTSLMIRKRQDKIPNLPPLDVTVVEKETSVTLGDITVEFFAIKKESPSELGLIIKTPYGDIVHNGTLRLETTQGVPSNEEEQRYDAFKNRNTLLLMADSTSAENPGFSITDNEIAESIDAQMKSVSTRLLVMTFSSQIERLIPVINAARKYNRKIAVDSKSILNTLVIADAMKLVTLDKETFINIEDIDAHKDNEVLILLSGEIGEEFASLVKIAAGQHKHLQISERDTILMASVEIMGLRRPLQNLKDKLSRQGAHLIHYKTSDVHSSGHANSEELVWIHKKINPRFFIPVHGYHYMLRVHADIERRLGMSESNIVIPDNGMIIEIRDEGKTITSLKERAPGEMIVVDGATVGKIQDVVMRDRQALAEDGMFVVIGVIDSHTHSLKKSPDLISRGFVYLKESQDLLYQTRLLTKKVIEDALAKGGYANLDQMKQDVAEATTKFLLQKTAKRPVIIPVIISV